MAFTSGNKTALGEAVSWAFAGACVIASIVYFDELKATFSPFPQGSEVTRAATMQRTQAPHTKRPAPAPQTVAVSTGNTVRLTASPSGHFETTAQINGRPTKVLVDTGATYVGLTYEDAESAGIYVRDQDFKYRVQTANGTTQIALVNIDRIAIGNIDVRNVKATVGQRGKQQVTLLGMSFLNKLRRTEMRSGQLLLEN